ncbi:MAG TPA: hypothetical protein VFK02_17730 [Kofleriaceae bacterium]|nr:hypothetical protein [Kofleriaceae bacterium]
MRQRHSNCSEQFFSRSGIVSLVPVRLRAHTRLVSVPKKPQDSVALYQHRLRVDHSSVRKLREVIDIVEALKAQRATSSDLD